MKKPTLGCYCFSRSVVISECVVMCLGDDGSFKEAERFGKRYWSVWAFIGNGASVLMLLLEGPHAPSSNVHLRVKRGRNEERRYTARKPECSMVSIGDIISA